MRRRMKEEEEEGGGRRKEEGGRRKEEGGRRKEEGCYDGSLQGLSSVELLTYWDTRMLLRVAQGTFCCPPRRKVPATTCYLHGSRATLIPTFQLLCYR